MAFRQLAFLLGSPLIIRVGAFTRYHDHAHEFIPAECMCEHLRCDEFLDKLNMKGYDNYTAYSVRLPDHRRDHEYRYDRDPGPDYEIRAWYRYHYFPKPGENECEILQNGWQCDCSRCKHPNVVNLCTCLFNTSVLPAGHGLDCPTNTTNQEGDLLRIEPGAVCTPHCPTGTRSTEATLSCVYGRLVEESFECHAEVVPPALLSANFIDNHAAYGVISGPIEVQMMPSSHTTIVRAFMGSSALQQAVRPGETSVLLWPPRMRIEGATNFTVCAGDYAENGSCISGPVTDLFIEHAAGAALFAVHLENLPVVARLSHGNACEPSEDISPTGGVGHLLFELEHPGLYTVCACPGICEPEDNFTEGLGAFYVSDTVVDEITVRMHGASDEIFPVSPLAIWIDGVEPETSQIFAVAEYASCEHQGEHVVIFERSLGSDSLWHASFPEAGDFQLCWTSYLLSRGQSQPNTTRWVARDGPELIGTLPVSSCSALCATCRTSAEMCTSCDPVAGGLCDGWRGAVLEQGTCSSMVPLQSHQCPHMVVECVMDERRGAPVDTHPEVLPQHLTWPQTDVDVGSENAIGQVGSMDMLGTTGLLVIDPSFDSSNDCPTEYVFSYFAQGALYLLNLTTGRARFACPLCCGAFKEPTSVRAVPSGVAWLVADAGRNLVYRIDAKTGDMSIFAGKAMSTRYVRFRYDYTQQIDTPDGLAYQDQPRPAVGAPSRSGESTHATEAYLCKPRALAVMDLGGLTTLIGEGNCYGDGTHFVRLVDFRGTINTVATVASEICPSALDTLHWVPGSRDRFVISCGNLILCTVVPASQQGECRVLTSPLGIIQAAGPMPSGNWAFVIEAAAATTIMVYPDLVAIESRDLGCTLAGQGPVAIQEAKIDNRLNYRIWGNRSKLSKDISTLLAAHDGTIFFAPQSVATGLARKIFRLRPPCGTGRGVNDEGICTACPAGTYQDGSYQYYDTCQPCSLDWTAYNATSNGCATNCFLKADYAADMTCTGSLEHNNYDLRLVVPRAGQSSTLDVPCSSRFGQLEHPGQCQACAEGKWCAGPEATGQASAMMRMQNGYFFDELSGTALKCSKASLCWWTPHHLRWHAVGLCVSTVQSLDLVGFSEVSTAAHCAGVQVGGNPGCCPPGRTGLACMRCEQGTFAPVTGAECRPCGNMGAFVALYFGCAFLVFTVLCAAVKMLNTHCRHVIFGVLSALGAIVGFVVRVQALYAHAGVLTSWHPDIWPMTLSVDPVSYLEWTSFYLMPLSMKCLIGEDLVARQAFLAFLPLPAVVLIAWSSRTVGSFSQKRDSFLHQIQLSFSESRNSELAAEGGDQKDAPPAIDAPLEDPAPVPADGGTQEAAATPDDSGDNVAVDVPATTAQEAAATPDDSGDNVAVDVPATTAQEAAATPDDSGDNVAVDVPATTAQAKATQPADDTADAGSETSFDMLALEEDSDSEDSEIAIEEALLNFASPYDSNIRLVAEVANALVAVFVFPFAAYALSFFHCYSHVKEGGKSQWSMVWLPEELCEGADRWKALPFAVLGVCYYVAWVVLQIRTASSIPASLIFSEWQYDDETRKNRKHGWRHRFMKWVSMPPLQHTLNRCRFGVYWWDLLNSCRAFLFYVTFALSGLPPDAQSFLMQILSVGSLVVLVTVKPNRFWIVNVWEGSLEFLTSSLLFFHRKAVRSIAADPNSLTFDQFFSTVSQFVVASFAIYVLARAVVALIQQDKSELADKADAARFASGVWNLACRAEKVPAHRLARELSKLDTHSLKEVRHSVSIIQQVMTPVHMHSSTRFSRLCVFDWRNKEIEQELCQGFEAAAERSQSLKSSMHSRKSRWTSTDADPRASTNSGRKRSTTAGRSSTGSASSLPASRNTTTVDGADQEQPGEEPMLSDEAGQNGSCEPADQNGDASTELAHAYEAAGLIPSSWTQEELGHGDTLTV